jgi:hypothetical protein
MKKAIFRGSIKRQLPQSVETVVYDVILDFVEVDNMAAKAANSKGGVCRDGALEVRITGRKKI